MKFKSQTARQPLYQRGKYVDGRKDYTKPADRTDVILVTEGQLYYYWTELVLGKRVKKIGLKPPMLRSQTELDVDRKRILKVQEDLDALVIPSPVILTPIRTKIRSMLVRLAQIRTNLKKRMGRSKTLAQKEDLTYTLDIMTSWETEIRLFMKTLSRKRVLTDDQRIKDDLNALTNKLDL